MEEKEIIALVRKCSSRSHVTEDFGFLLWILRLIDAKT